MFGSYKVKYHPKHKLSKVFRMYPEITRNQFLHTKSVRTHIGNKLGYQHYVRVYFDDYLRPIVISLSPYLFHPGLLVHAQCAYLVERYSRRNHGALQRVGRSGVE